MDSKLHHHHHLVYSYYQLSATAVHHHFPSNCLFLSAMANSHHHHHGTANSCYQLSATAYTVPFKSIVNCSHPLGNETTWYRPDALLKIMLLSRLLK
ncbi:hypothetical protein DERF_000858 [Dermatophagoides farinae]|uniref:Uncharacterized protein n=1 Tax=Dermatophagoides farinae TaxID=6954 RepID=A0A922L842_DERFA|nr:hypothetical protein DERF_000858 [Dermatophagoides farinae]